MLQSEPIRRFQVRLASEVIRVGQAQGYKLEEVLHVDPEIIARAGEGDEAAFKAVDAQRFKDAGDGIRGHLLQLGAQFLQVLGVHQVFHELLPRPVVALPMHDALDPLLARQKFLDQPQLVLLRGTLPRVFGLMIALPAVTVCFQACAIGSGWLATAVLEGRPLVETAGRFLDFADPWLALLSLLPAPQN